MNEKLFRIPIIMLWSSTAMLALRLLKIHLKHIGLFDHQAAIVLTQVKIIVLVAILSALLNEGLRLISFIFFGDDDGE